MRAYVQAFAPYSVTPHVGGCLETNNPHTCAAGNSSTSEAEVLKRIDNAVAAALQARAEDEEQLLKSMAGSSAIGHADTAAVSARMAAAAAEARSQAEAEGEEQMTDLLICLGQEEQKVGVYNRVFEMALSCAGRAGGRWLCTVKTNKFRIARGWSCGKDLQLQFLSAQLMAVLMFLI